MKNKNGWGFIEFIAFLIIFIICLIIAGMGLRRLGLLDDNFQMSNPNTETQEKEKVTNYVKLEKEAMNKTKEYIKDFYDNKLGLDTLNIKISQLVDNGYLEDDLRDANNKKCSGYVSVYVNDSGKIEYIPYIKCPEYQTAGYEERKDG